MISARGLTLRSRGAVFLDAIDLSISRGESLAIAGPDAARAAVMQVLATVRPPLKGRLEISGLDAVRDVYAVRKLVAFSGVGAPMPGNRMRVGEHLHAVASAREQPPSAGNGAAALVGLHPDDVIDDLSPQLRLRLMLATAIATNAPLTLLADPFAPLDDEGRSRVAAWLKDRKARGGTLVIAAERDAPYAALVDRAVSIDSGGLVPMTIAAPPPNAIADSELVIV